MMSHNAKEPLHPISRQGIAATANVLLVLACTTTAVSHAHAQPPRMLELVSDRTMQRAQRAIAFGPTIGGSAVLADGELDGLLSFGLGFYVFDIAVLPTPASMLAALQDRAMREALRRAADMIATGYEPAIGMDVQTLAATLVEDVRAELMRQLLAQSKPFERPRFSIDIEGGYLVRAGTWGGRLTATYGIGPISLGPTTLVSTDDVTLGPELSLRLLRHRGGRPPVLNLFMRADFAMRDRDTRPDYYGVGARLLLDLI